MQRADRPSAPEAREDDQLAAVLGTDPPPFALLHRPESAAGPDRVEVLVGDVRPVGRLADLPLPPQIPPGDPRHDVLAVIPFRQVCERGFECRDDGEPILAMTVASQCTVPLAEVMHRLPTGPVPLTGAGFDVDDDRYADTVRRVLAEEIGDGAGSNFVIKRSFRARIPGYTPRAALALFRGLLVGELGAYWTFLVYTGGRTFVGATPERQVSALAGEVVMNPISGTYRYPSTGPSLPGTLAFLSDRKEAGELYMVVDEELKMMASICDGGGRVVGPHLKEMARLAHTEYLLQGRSSLDVREVLRRTLVAPTVTGSPVESACRVIARHESAGRGFYSGVIATIGRDAAGRRTLDSAILIRTADIDSGGAVEIGVGATLVRDSDPDAEVAETRAKAAGLLAAAGADAGGALHSGPGRAKGGTTDRGLAGDHRVLAALARRNATLARYWFDTEDDRRQERPDLVGRQVLVLDAEDTFTAMHAQQLRSLGLAVTVRPCTEAAGLESFDLVVAGPGPGEPWDRNDPRIAALWQVVGRLLRGEVPFLCVCLSHQVLASALGLELVRRETPNQGVQEEIDLFGRRERVGFYNTFAARSEHDLLHRVGLPGPVRVSRDRYTGEVHALRGPGFASTQFHPESLLTQNGVHILNELVRYALNGWPEGVFERSG
ncbi:MAG TPA: anthranilate synthase family protein [Pseudonocardiaceae bacterium]|nr:anthranilate synthase family protein [Pseudonocardiaceae bacterium]